MSPHRIFLICLLGVAAACDHPTAPQAREAAERTDAKLTSGDFGQLESGLWELFDIATSYGSAYYGSTHPAIPTSYSAVSRNGIVAPYRTTAIERIYLPPEESGAMPASRFTIIGWSDADSAQRRRLVVMLTSDSLAPIRIPLPGTTANTRLRGAFALTADQANRRTGYGTDGELRIRVGPRIGGCPYEGKSVYASGLAELQDTTKRVLCETRRYDASMASFIERGDPAHRDLARMVSPIRETLRLTENSIPGVRLVARCTGKPEKDPMPCFDYWSFWRDDSQFAPALGVKLDSMKLLNGSMVQVVDSGGAPDYHEVRGGYDPPISYAVRSTTGELIRRVDRTTPQTDQLVGQIAWQFPMRVGARYRVIRNAPGLIPGASPYAMAVVDITYLPHSR